MVVVYKIDQKQLRAALVRIATEQSITPPTTNFYLDRLDDSSGALHVYFFQPNSTRKHIMIIKPAAMIALFRNQFKIKTPKQYKLNVVRTRGMGFVLILAYNEDSFDICLDLIQDWYDSIKNKSIKWLRLRFPYFNKINP